MKNVKSFLHWGGVLVSLVAVSLAFLGCPTTEEESEESTTTEGKKSSVPVSKSGMVSGAVTTGWDYVKTKYSKDTSGNNQTTWNAVNCHDPKLFQDDDGTYYVYATDASVGNQGFVGVHVRWSKDLVSWEGSGNSALNGYWDTDQLIWEDYVASSGEVRQNNGDYGAYTWAPTVIKLNSLYYMYHGVNADVGTGSKKRPGSSIVLAIASNAKGPFYPASFISNYTAGSDIYGNDGDILSIKAILEGLGVTYKQNFLVRYTVEGSNLTPLRTPSYDGETLATPEEQRAMWSKTNNSWFGCIDPEFVFDIATGKLMEYSKGSNTCYALIYGSWLKGIALVYVDKISLKPVATMEATYGGRTYAVGDELEVSLDEVNTTQSSSGPRMLGTQLTGGSGCGYEGAQLFYNSETQYYYLITSCGGLEYEYRCTLGRSKTIEGPYLDASGRSMSDNDISSTAGDAKFYHNVGSKIIGAYALGNDYPFRCQGGLSVLRTSTGKIIFACHTRTNFQPGYYFYLQCHQMFFNSEGWPVLNQNEYYSDYKTYTTDGTESLTTLKLADIAGSYDTILTVRGSDTAAVSTLGIYGADNISDVVSKQDAVPTVSKTLTILDDGTITGSNYTGSVSLAADGYTATIELKDAAGNMLGTFHGYFMHAVDWARRSGERRTITFTTLCSETSAAEAGEFFWGNKQQENLWTVSSDGKTATYSESASDTTGIVIPVLSGITATTGFTVEFKATLPSDTNDWGAQILSYKNCHVTIPNLDPWNNTISGSNLNNVNAFPTAEGASLSNGRIYNSAFDGKMHTIKIVFTQNTIVFYLDNTTWVTYSSSVWSGKISEFIGYYITGLNTGAVTFNAADLNISGVKITAGVD